MTIAVASGKGGTGKTFLATNLFAVMRQSGLSVVLVDCDAEVPNDAVFVKGQAVAEWPTSLFLPAIDTTACTCCRICARNCHFNAIVCIPVAKYIRVMPELCHGCRSCLLDCPEQAVHASQKTIGKVTAYDDGDGLRFFEARANEGERTPVPVVREAVGRASGCGAGYMVLDAPPGCSCPFVNTVAGADYVVLVSEPTPFGLSDLKHTVEVLRQMHKPFGVVVNRSDIGDKAMKSWLNDEKIDLLAEIPYSEQVAALYAKGELAVGRMPEMTSVFENIMHYIVNHESCSHQRERR